MASKSAFVVVQNKISASLVTQKKLQKHRVSIGFIAIVLIVLIALIIVGYKFDWTGFNGYYKVTTHIMSGSSSGTVTRTERVLSQGKHFGIG